RQRGVGDAHPRAGPVGRAGRGAGGEDVVAGSLEPGGALGGNAAVRAGVGLCGGRGHGGPAEPEPARRVDLEVRVREQVGSELLRATKRDVVDMEIDAGCWTGDVDVDRV